MRQERRTNNPERLDRNKRNGVGTWAKQKFEQLRTATNLDFRAKQGARGLLMALMMGIQADHELQPLAPNFPRTGEELKTDVIPQFKQDLQRAIRSGKEVQLQGVALNAQLDIDRDGLIDNFILEDVVATDGTFDSYDVTPKQIFTHLGDGVNMRMPQTLLADGLQTAIEKDYRSIEVPAYSVTMHESQDVVQAEVVSWMQEQTIGVVEIPAEELRHWKEHWDKRSYEISKEIDGLKLSEEASIEEHYKRLDAEKTSNPEWQQFRSQFYPKIVEIVRSQRAVDQELFRDFARRTLTEPVAEDTDALTEPVKAVDTDIYTLDWKFTPDGNGLETLRYLNEVADISFFSNKSQSKVEHLSGEESLKFSHGELNEYGQGSLVIDGMVESVELTIHDIVDMPELKAEQRFTDQFGNTIRVNWAGAYPMITVRIPRPFVLDKVQVSKPISLDLTPIGLGIYEAIAEQPTIQPTAIVEKSQVGSEAGYYGIFATNQIEWDADAQDYAEGMGNGIKIAESLFGFKPGEFIQNVFIPDMDTYNAYAENLGLHTIVVTDEYFRLQKHSNDSYGRDEEHRWQVQDAAMHESFHQLEANLGIRNDERITKLFQELPFSILSGFSEEHWFTEFPLRASGGHAYENPAEFLASFLVTTQDYDFDKSIAAKGQEMAAVYLQVLDVVEAALNDRMPKEVLAAQGRYEFSPEDMPGKISYGRDAFGMSFYHTQFDHLRKIIASTYPELATQAEVKMR